jgi:NCAIR mutase (PurE)-related protein
VAPAVGQDEAVDEVALRRLLDDLGEGRVTADDAVAQLRRLPFADLGFARLYHHRGLRQGVAEAVYAPGKTASQCATIIDQLLATASGPVILTRAGPDQIDTSLAIAPDGAVLGTTVVWRPSPPRDENVAVLTAGTADLVVADECVATLGAYGVVPHRLTDVGVAGLHPLLADIEVVTEACAVVVVAGMDGALASVVGGITAAPLVAVPTSVGHGAALEGVTALLSMLASCAAGVTVVGIDNGFGAACAVARMLDVRSTRGGSTP